MKILHIFHNSDLNNGVDRTILTLATQLRDSGVQTHCIVPGKGIVSHTLSEKGISWQIMSLACCSGPSWRAQFRYLGDSGERLNQLKELLRVEKFDVVHLNTGHQLDAALAAAIAGTPVIWHIHGLFEIDYQRYEGLLSPLGYAWILNALGSRIVTVSEDIRRSILNYILDEKKVITVYNGVDAEALMREAEESSTNIRIELDIPRNAFLVIGVGRISKHKNFVDFIKVAERVLIQDPHTYFVIAGSFEDPQIVADLERRIKTSFLDGKVFLLGSRSDVPSLMKQSNVLLSTSVCEGHPLAVLEAMAMGLPVVAMACVGVPECIHDGVDGLLIPQGDIDTAANALMRILYNGDEAKRFSLAGIKKVKTQFSKESYATQFLKVVYEAIAIGPSHTEPGAIELICGLLKEINNGRDYIKNFENGKNPSSFQSIKNFIIKQNCIPWRLSNAYVNWLEKRVRPSYPALYKLLKYHRVDLNTQKYWDKVWTSEDPMITRNYERMFNKIVEIVPYKSNVLDVGCGPGLLLKRLKAEKECIPCGIDISKKAISVLNKAGIEGKVAHLPKIPLPNDSFDVVIATEVLEHIKSPSRVIEEMSKKLKKGGLLILSVPDNTLHPSEELEHLHSFNEVKLSSLLEPYIEISGIYRDYYRDYYLENKPEKFLAIYGKKR